MKQYVLTEQHYDMAAGTIVYFLDARGPQALTSLDEEGIHLRMVPYTKLKEAECQLST